MEKFLQSLPAYTGVGFTKNIVHKVPDSRGCDWLDSDVAHRFLQTKKSCLGVATSPDLRISLVEYDSGNEEHTQKLRDAVVNEHGRLDLLVNNAGLVSTDVSAWDKISDVRSDQFRITMEGNYIGGFLTMKYLIPTLLGSPSGAKMVINVTSICSHFVDRAPAGFNISELASDRLTEIAAGQYADEGLVLYSLHPGTVATRLPPGMPAEVLAFAPDEPGLCGSFCLWLVNKRPAWLSGRYLSSDWDTSELEEKKDDIITRDLLKSRMSL